MASIIRPMLAGKADLAKLVYPVCVSPKLDGIRALAIGGSLYSRTGKLLPNSHTQELFKDLHGIDGELTVGSPTEGNVFNRTTSGVMSVEGTPDIVYNVFDCFDVSEPYFLRFKALNNRVKGHPNVNVVPTIFNIKNEDELLTYERQFVSAGYEGLIIRQQNDKPYKNGRSTVKEGSLLKLKRFSDSEATILGCEPFMHNDNVLEKDELGYAKRSTCTAGKVALDTLGALNVKDVKTGIEFQIGSGFTKEQRDNLWKSKDDLIGKLVKYKYFEVGCVEKPRFPVFLGFRDWRDYEK